MFIFYNILCCDKFQKKDASFLRFLAEKRLDKKSGKRGVTAVTQKNVNFLLCTLLP
jgi:hypothetical protein